MGFSLDPQGIPNGFSNDLHANSIRFQLDLHLKCCSPALLNYLKYLAERRGVWLRSSRRFPFFRHLLILKGKIDNDENMKQYICAEPSAADLEILKKTHDARIKIQRSSPWNSSKEKRRFIIGGQNTRETVGEGPQDWPALWRREFDKFVKKNEERKVEC